MFNYLVITEDQAIYGLNEIDANLGQAADDGIVSLINMKEQTEYEGYGVWKPITIYK